MQVNSRFAVAWSMALSPIVLFIPAFLLAGMGPCTYTHPLVIVGAFLLFICLEIAALPRFVKAARATGKAVGAMLGMGLALLLLVACIAFEYTAVTDYWIDMRLGLM